MNDDIKKKFMLPLTIELQDHKEKVFDNAAVSPTVWQWSRECPQ